MVKPPAPLSLPPPMESQRASSSAGPRGAAAATRSAASSPSREQRGTPARRHQQRAEGGPRRTRKAPGGARRGGGGGGGSVSTGDSRVGGMGADAIHAVGGRVDTLESLVQHLRDEVEKLEAENLDIVDQVNISLGACDDRLNSIDELKHLVVSESRLAGAQGGGQLSAAAAALISPAASPGGGGGGWQRELAKLAAKQMQLEEQMRRGGVAVAQAAKGAAAPRDSAAPAAVDTSSAAELHLREEKRLVSMEARLQAVETRVSSDSVTWQKQEQQQQQRIVALQREVADMRRTHDVELQRLSDRLRDAASVTDTVSEAATSTEKAVQDQLARLLARIESAERSCSECTRAVESSEADTQDIALQIESVRGQMRQEAQSRVDATEQGMHVQLAQLLARIENAELSVSKGSNYADAKLQAESFKGTMDAALADFKEEIDLKLAAQQETLRGAQLEAEAQQRLALDGLASTDALTQSSQDIRASLRHMEEETHASLAALRAEWSEQHSTQLQELESRLTSVLSETQSNAALSVAAGARLDEAEAAHAAMCERLDQLSATTAEGLAALRQEQSESSQSVETALAALTDEVRSSQRVDELEASIRQVEQSAAASTTTVRKELHDAISEVLDTVKTATSSSCSSEQADFEEWAEQHSTQLQELESRLTSVLSETQSNAALSVAAGARLDEAEAAHAAMCERLDQLSATAAEGLAALRQEQSESSQSVETALAALTDEVRSSQRVDELEASIRQVELDTTEGIATVTAANSDGLNSALETLEKKARELERSAEAAVATAVSEVQDAVTTTLSSRDEQTNAMLAEMKKELTALATQLSEMTSGASDDLGCQLESLQSEFEVLRASEPVCADALSSLRESHAQTMSDLSAKLSDLEEQSWNDTETLQTALDELQAKVKVLESTPHAAVDVPGESSLLDDLA
eukprot:COSAG01_NODE_6436_length_3668_cov_52.167274_1_plen_932_part_00